MAKPIYVDNPDPAGPDIDPETNTIDVGGGMFGSRIYIPPPPDGDKGDDGNRRYRHPSLRRGATGGGPSQPSFNSHWFDQLGPSKGETPTAEQEALQDPTIDPVFMLAGGLVGGEESAAAQIPRNRLAQESKELLEFLKPGTSLRAMIEKKAAGYRSPISEFAKGAAQTAGKGAITQAITPGKIGKVGSLPIGNKAMSLINHILNIADRAVEYDRAPW